MGRGGTIRKGHEEWRGKREVWRGMITRIHDVGTWQP